MALILLNPGLNPLGQFDGYDSQVTSFKGGEVCTWVGVSTTGTDQAAADIFNDGYLGTTSKTRPAVTFTVASGSRPLFLADDGTTGYGTLLGSVVGATVGMQSVNGAVLGPHTAAGSGKITLWDKPGLYGVTLDAVDTAADGLVTTNATLTVGKALVYTATGQLTPQGSTNAVGSARVVGYLAEFATNGSMVTTPNNLVSALNSPSGGVSSLQMQKFSSVSFWYVGA